MPEPTPRAPYGPLPRGGVVRPITRWGTAVMHRRNEPVEVYDEELRMPGRRHGRDDVRRRRRRPRGLPDRRRPGGVRLRLPRRVGRAHRRRGLQPGADPPRGQGPEPRRRRRGVPVLPGCVRGVRAAGLRDGDRHRAGRRAGRVLAATACWPAASSTRPTTPTARSSGTGCRPRRASGSRRRWRRPPTSTRRAGRRERPSSARGPPVGGDPRRARGWRSRRGQRDQPGRADAVAGVGRGDRHLALPRHAGGRRASGPRHGSPA